MQPGKAMRFIDLFNGRGGLYIQGGMHWAPKFQLDFLLVFNNN